MQQLDQKLQAWLDQVGARLDGFAENLKDPHLHINAARKPCDEDGVRTDGSTQIVQPEQPKQVGPEYQLEANQARINEPLVEQEAVVEQPEEQKQDYHRASTRHRTKYIQEMMTVRSQHMNPELRNFCSRILMHPYFDSVVCTFVAVSAVLVGAEVQYTASTFNSSHQVLEILEYVCTAFFTFELMIRVFGYGLRKLCESPMRRWFAFDAFLVVMPFLDAGMSLVLGNLSPSSSQVSMSKMLKVVKISKVLRLVRVMRFCGDLRVMAMMIISSLQSLFWLMCLLIMLLYIVAIVLTQGATEYREQPGGEHLVTMDAQYGSLWLTMYTLFKCMCGGVSWGEASDPLVDTSFMYFLVFVTYIFFALFSFVNIVTGVFVDSAIQTAERDRSIVVEKQRKQKEALIKNLLVVLEEIDSDSSGTLTTEELMTAFKTEHLANFFAHLNIEMADMEQLMYLLDSDGNGCIDIVEFVDGVQSCCGQARSLDILILKKEVEHMTTAINAVLKGMTDSSSIARESKRTTLRSTLNHW